MSMKEFWEQRYSAAEYAYGTEPNAFLVAQAKRLTPGAKVLVVGDGEGRNGVWLAAQGFAVTSVDYSAAGLEKARRLAASRGVRIETVYADLTEWQWPVESFDAVVSIFVHFPSAIRRRLHEAMLAALRPGGEVIMEAFTKDQLRYRSGGPPNEDMLFSAELLAEDFAEAKMRVLDERVTHLDEGRFHHGDGAVVQMIAQRNA